MELYTAVVLKRKDGALFRDEQRRCSVYNGGKYDLRSKTGSQV
jgi:hypothetical protein